MQSDFVPSEMIKKAARKWWVFAGLMILGGLVGMLITRIHKPVYQSQAVITTAIDYAYAGRLEDYELDHLILTVGDIIDSTQVKQAVITRAHLEMPGISDDAILNSLTAIRKGSDWILSSRASDAPSAQKLGQWWAEEAMNSLSKMNEKAVEAFHIQTVMLSIEKCFSESVVIPSPVSGCSSDEVDAIKTLISGDSISGQSLRESILLSNLSFEVTTDALLPSSPVLFRQNLNVLAGAIIGLLVAFGWFFLGGKQG